MQYLPMFHSPPLVACLAALLTALNAVFGAETHPANPIEAPKPYGAIPSKRQIAYSKSELIGILHLSLNTYTDKEWGYGDENVSTFNPTQFDARQIVQAAKSAGLKRLIIVAKHHCGFCLWPSAYNSNFSIKNTPWRKGKGDMVRELVDACRDANIEVGIYLSPWDRNHKDYGTQAYVDYYHQQLRELLSNYGPVSEVWFDGANGGDGYYGGFRGKRAIDGKTYYQWDKVMQIVRTLQPDAVCFNQADIRWVGNEKGYAGDPCWSTQGSKDDTGDRNGNSWMPAEADFPLRKGWFWHRDEKPKSPAYLVNRYFSTVGRNAVMDLGIAPDCRGVICDDDLASLSGFGKRLRAIFKTNLAEQAKATASNVRGNDPAYSPTNVIRGNNTGLYWATDDHVTNAELTLDFGRPTQFNIVSLREHTPLGQRVDNWALDSWSEGQWKEFSKGTGISSRRLWRGEPVTTTKLRLRILNASACPAISEVSVYLEPESSRKESLAALTEGIEKGLPKQSWKVVNPAVPATQRLIDGDPTTFWYSGKGEAPQSITIDMGDLKDVSSILYLPRQDFNMAGTIITYSVALSLDGKTWRENVAKGEFSNIINNPVQQRIKLPNVQKARFFRLSALQTVPSGLSGAEIGATGK